MALLWCALFLIGQTYRRLDGLGLRDADVVNTSQPIKRILTAMSWKRLTIDDLRLILSEDETQKLDTLSLNEDITEPVNQTILLVSNTWR